MKAGIVIPFFNHAQSIGYVVQSLKQYGMPCWIVDDGSDATCTEVLSKLVSSESHWLRLVSYTPNQGKGMAVMTGCECAYAAGCTHALQIDADGQHDARDVPKLLDAARRHPEALVTGTAVYDQTVPKARLYGRQLTHVWVWINTLSLQIRDSMCGFRVYPLAPTLHVWQTERVGRRMDFDIEIMVRMFWNGVPVINVPTRVTYPRDGVSHFDVWADNVRISRMHARLFFGMLRRSPGLLRRRLAHRRHGVAA